MIKRSDNPRVSNNWGKRLNFILPERVHTKCLNENLTGMLVIDGKSKIITITPHDSGTKFTPCPNGDVATSFKAPKNWIRHGLLDLEWSITSDNEFIGVANLDGPVPPPKLQKTRNYNRIKEKDLKHKLSAEPTVIRPHDEDKPVIEEQPELKQEPKKLSVEPKYIQPVFLTNKPMAYDIIRDIGDLEPKELVKFKKLYNSLYGKKLWIF